jgi:hypothetical protein
MVFAELSRGRQIDGSESYPFLDRRLEDKK